MQLIFTVLIVMVCSFYIFLQIYLPEKREKNVRNMASAGLLLFLLLSVIWGAPLFEELAFNVFK